MIDFFKKLISQNENIICYNLDILKEFATKVYTDFSSIDNIKILYAIKANSDLHILNTLAKLGVGADCASKEEVMLSIKAEFEYISATGPSFDTNDIKNYLKNYIHFDFDNYSQLIAVRKELYGKMIGIRGRLNGYPSRFGIDFTSKEFLEFIESYNIKVHSIHFHYGNKNKYNLKKLCDDIIDSIKQSKILSNISFVNIGGGIESFYKQKQENSLVKILIEFKKEIKKLLGRDITLILEPGSLFTLPIGYLKTKVKYILKHSNTAILDVSAFNFSSWNKIYPICHNYDFIKGIKDGRFKYKIVGNTCFEEDIFGEFYFLHELKEGDNIILFPIGAYNFCLSRNLHAMKAPDIIYFENGELVYEK